MFWLFCAISEYHSLDLESLQFPLWRPIMRALNSSLTAPPCPCNPRGSNFFDDNSAYSFFPFLQAHCRPKQALHIPPRLCKSWEGLLRHLRFSHQTLPRASTRRERPRQTLPYICREASYMAGCKTLFWHATIACTSVVCRAGSDQTLPTYERFRHALSALQHLKSDCLRS